ncbi:MAG: hypothetical protein AAGF12_42025 [Myxococcota bacterium]
MLRRISSTIVDLFLLRREAAALRKVEAKQELRERLVLGRQREAAADTLWFSGYRADGLRLAFDALEVTVDAVASAMGQSTEDLHPSESSPEEADPGEERDEPTGSVPLSSNFFEQIEEASSSRPPPKKSSPTLDRRLVGAKAAEAWTVAQRELAQRPRLPLFEREIGREQVKLYRRVVRARRVLDQVAGPKSLSRPRLWGRRVLRVGTVVVAVAAIAFYFLRPLPPVAVSASAQFDQRYPPENLIDGSFEALTHEWLLPWQSPGWVELRFGGEKRLSVFRLKNACHPPHHSLGSKAIRVEFFQGSERIAIRTGQFGAPNITSPWLEFVDVEAPVDRIRIHVDSFYGNGGGLAEAEWVEAR